MKQGKKKGSKSFLRGGDGGRMALIIFLKMPRFSLRNECKPFSICIAYTTDRGVPFRKPCGISWPHHGAGERDCS